MKLRHTRDTLEVFLYVVRNGRATTEEIATCFGRSRYWASGLLGLLVEETNLLNVATPRTHSEAEVLTYFSEYKDELEALRVYVATCE